MTLEDQIHAGRAVYQVTDVIYLYDHLVWSQYSHHLKLNHWFFSGLQQTTTKSIRTKSDTKAKARKPRKKSSRNA